MLSALEQRRAGEMSAQVATLAENPTLKAALDPYRTETGAARQLFRREMLLTIDRELEKIAARVRSDILAVTDGSGTVLAVAGRRQGDWPVNARVPTQQDSTGEAYVSLPSGVFQFASAPVSLQDTEIGSLQLAKALDARYAQELSALSGAGTLIVSGEQTVASTLNAESTRALTPAVLHALPSSDVVKLGTSEYAVKLLFQNAEAAVYALGSIGASTRVPMQDALRAVAIIAMGSFALAGFASLWLARTISPTRCRAPSRR
jgi:hypothetical protein